MTSHTAAFASRIVRIASGAPPTGALLSRGWRGPSIGKTGKFGRPLYWPGKDCAIGNPDYISRFRTCTYRFDLRFR